MLDTFRYKGYWMVDWISGRKVGNNYNQICKVLNDDSRNNPNITNHKLINRILQHAVKNVTYYNGYNTSDLTKYPVINKTLIRNNFERFISKAFNEKDLIRVVTSGSTGTPFQVYHDINKRNRNTADTIYFGEMAGFKLGHKLFYFKVWNNVNKKSLLTLWMQNLIPCDVTNLSDIIIEKHIVKMSEEQKPFGLLGYASVYDAILSYCLRNNINKINTKVKSIISMSESLATETKQKISEIFGCPVLSRYSNVENGIIAQQVPDSGLHFIINSASYHVEILKFESDEPQTDGEIGRIVITDLFNYGMPMIRYDTGDTGSKRYDAKLKKMVFDNIEGRRMDLIYNPQGKLMSSFTITNNMWLFPEITQYQFIQKTENKYHFKLNVDGCFNRENELIEEFKKHFGKEAEFTVEYVDEIPQLQSGKRKKVVNEMKD